jgi:hypothetical protein
MGERICAGLEFLDGPFEVTETREERQIARHCRKLLIENQRLKAFSQGTSIAHGFVDSMSTSC